VTDQHDLGGSIEKKNEKKRKKDQKTGFCICNRHRLACKKPHSFDQHTGKHVSQGTIDAVVPEENALH
jgi:hypothetical protein